MNTYDSLMESIESLSKELEEAREAATEAEERVGKLLVENFYLRNKLNLAKRALKVLAEIPVEASGKEYDPDYMMDCYIRVRDVLDARLALEDVK